METCIRDTTYPLAQRKVTTPTFPCNDFGEIDVMYGGMRFVLNICPNYGEIGSLVTQTSPGTGQTTFFSAGYDPITSMYSYTPSNRISTITGDTLFKNLYETGQVVGFFSGKTESVNFAPEYSGVDNPTLIKFISSTRPDLLLEYVECGYIKDIYLASDIPVSRPIALDDTLSRSDMRFVLLGNNLPEGVAVTEDGIITGVLNIPGDYFFKCRVECLSKQTSVLRGYGFQIRSPYRPGQTKIFTKSGSLGPTDLRAFEHIDIDVGIDFPNVGDPAIIRLLGTLPAGVTFDPTSCRIEGYPEEAGTFDFKIVHQDGHFVTSEDFSITVGLPRYQIHPNCGHMSISRGVPRDPHEPFVFRDNQGVRRIRSHAFSQLGYVDAIVNDNGSVSIERYWDVNPEKTWTPDCTPVDYAYLNGTMHYCSANGTVNVREGQYVGTEFGMPEVRSPVQIPVQTREAITKTGYSTHGIFWNGRWYGVYSDVYGNNTCFKSTADWETWTIHAEGFEFFRNVNGPWRTACFELKDHLVFFSRGYMLVCKKANPYDAVSYNLSTTLATTATTSYGAYCHFKSLMVGGALKRDVLAFVDANGSVWYNTDITKPTVWGKIENTVIKLPTSTVPCVMATDNFGTVVFAVSNTGYISQSNVIPTASFYAVNNVKSIDDIKNAYLLKNAYFDTCQDNYVLRFVHGKWFMASDVYSSSNFMNSGQLQWLCPEENYVTDENQSWEMLKFPDKIDPLMPMYLQNSKGEWAWRIFFWSPASGYCDLDPRTGNVVWNTNRLPYSDSTGQSLRFSSVLVDRDGRLVLTIFNKPYPNPINYVDIANCDMDAPWSFRVPSSTDQYATRVIFNSRIFDIYYRWQTNALRINFFPAPDVETTASSVLYNAVHASGTTDAIGYGAKSVSSCDSHNYREYRSTDPAAVFICPYATKVYVLDGVNVGSTPTATAVTTTERISDAVYWPGALSFIFSDKAGNLYTAPTNNMTQLKNFASWTKYAPAVTGLPARWIRALCMAKGRLFVVSDNGRMYYKDMTSKTDFSGFKQYKNFQLFDTIGNGDAAVVHLKYADGYIVGCTDGSGVTPLSGTGSCVFYSRF